MCFCSISPRSDLSDTKPSTRSDKAGEEGGGLGGGGPSMQDDWGLNEEPLRPPGALQSPQKPQKSSAGEVQMRKPVESEEGSGFVCSAMDSGRPPAVGGR